MRDSCVVIILFNLTLVICSSRHLAWFGAHEFSAGGDIMHLICHVTSHELLIERHANLWVGFLEVCHVIFR